MVSRSREKNARNTRLPTTTTAATETATISTTATTATAAELAVARANWRAIIVVSLLRRATILELDFELVVGLAHLSEADMHLPEEVIRKSTVVVKPREIGAADIADLQLLMAGRTRRVLKGTELLPAFVEFVLHHAHAPELDGGQVDAADAQEHADLGYTAVDVVFEVTDLLNLETIISKDF